MVIIEFIKENAAEMWMIWGAVITIASVIVKLTPNKKDDKIFAVVFKILNALALNPNVPNDGDEKKKKEQEAEEQQEKLEAELDERNDSTTRDTLVNELE